MGIWDVVGCGIFRCDVSDVPGEGGSAFRWIWALKKNRRQVGDLPAIASSRCLNVDEVGDLGEKFIGVLFFIEDGVEP